MQHEFDAHLRQLLRRRRWLRRLLRPLPRRANVHRYPVIKWFGDRAKRFPFLWSFKRANVIPALYGGMVLSLLPLYGFQLLLAFGLALLLRANLTITVALQFITNPLTIVPIYGATTLLGVELMEWAGAGADMPRPLFYANALFVGGVVAGLGLALLADLLWRFAAWEAGVFKAKYHALRERAHQHALEKAAAEAATRSARVDPPRADDTGPPR